LDNLKEWLTLRARFFTSAAADFGIDKPKGILLTGIPGCGKSVCVKAICAKWHLPLFRLDMDKIFGGGSPEESLRRAFKTVEAASPAVLWIDELEKSVAGYTGGGSSGGDGTEARLFGMFLTWMQDKENPVVVAATANEVDRLPPEILRKGRFDEIFFVDLPNQIEREEIFAIHLRHHKQDVGRFDLPLLAKGTNGFTGSEIEQVVLAGLYNAFEETRELTNNDLHRVGGKMVALSVTMAERIKDLKRWAQFRAVKATKAVG
jgi:SpoVK/Ycf46/Vps4 family AAA+-type ATPase